MNITKEGNNEGMTKSAQTLHQKRTEELPSTLCHGWLSICIELLQFTTEMSSMQEHLWRQVVYILWGCDAAWGFRTLCLCSAKLLFCQKQKAVLESLVCNFLYADIPCSLHRLTQLYWMREYVFILVFERVSSRDFSKKGMNKFQGF